MPARDRVWLDDGEAPGPTAPEAAQQDSEESVGGADDGVPSTSQGGELLAEGQVLDHEVTARAHGRAERRQEGHQEAKHRAGKNPDPRPNRQWFQRGSGSGDPRWSQPLREAFPSLQRLGSRDVDYLRTWIVAEEIAANVEALVMSQVTRLEAKCSGTCRSCGTYGIDSAVAVDSQPVPRLDRPTQMVFRRRRALRSHARSCSRIPSAHPARLHGCRADATGRLPGALSGKGGRSRFQRAISLLGSWSTVPVSASSR